MINVRHGDERGVADFGWLFSKHTFSFGQYYDPNFMGFSSLRVINDDQVAPSAGFDTHGHKNMEIISYVLQGRIAHKDSAGNIKTLPKGEFQLMSAGKGIYHSEFNASDNETLKFLQIWIMPNEHNTEPGYQQKAFGTNKGLTTIITPNGENGTLKIRQDMKLHQLIMDPDQSVETTFNYGKNVYIHLISSSLEINDTKIQPGDGAMISDEGILMLTNSGNEELTALIFEMQ
ncbi:pirin family protein [Vibrio viridaestus]|uniref:Pirin family protein n=1 Tax=Vibrio viridaestus TaxID=2487322 RepID=A0A3N9TD75_9VIBR|nr:pirin family protein [Vibrio viridaestus]RQW61804.1 pirin family protein [Vibrio viridaestus]